MTTIVNTDVPVMRTWSNSSRKLGTLDGNVRGSAGQVQSGLCARLRLSYAQRHISFMNTARIWTKNVGGSALVHLSMDPGCCSWVCCSRSPSAQSPPPGPKVDKALLPCSHRKQSIILQVKASDADQMELSSPIKLTMDRTKHQRVLLKRPNSPSTCWYASLSLVKTQELPHFLACCCGVLL